MWVVSSVCCGARVWEAPVRKRRKRIHSPRVVYAFGSFLRLKKPGVAHPRHLQLHRSCMLSFSHSTIPGNLCFPEHGWSMCTTAELSTGVKSP